MAFPDLPPDAPSRPRPGGFARLLASYALACLTAVIILPLLLFLHDVVAIGPKAAAASVAFPELVAILIVGFPVVFIFAAPFTTALIVVNEMLRLTGLAVYLVGGAAIGVLVGVIAHQMPAITPTVAATPLGSYLLYAVIGLASGAVFWYFAVRPLRRR